MVGTALQTVFKIFSASTREADLRRRLTECQVKLHRAEFEKELLAEVNENLRQWLLANTAAATAIGQHLGVKEEKHRAA